MKLKEAAAPVDRYLIRSKEDIDNIWPWIGRMKGWANFEDGAYYLLVYEKEKNVNLRSMNQNGLYWEWMGQMAKHFSKKGGKLTKEQAHDLMRHQFLGYENYMIGRTELQPRLMSTTKLRKNEMSEYMHKIDAWAADHGLLLSYPGDGDYAEYKEART